MVRNAIGWFWDVFKRWATPSRSSLVNRGTHLGHYTRRPTGNLLTHLIWHLTNNRVAGNSREVAIYFASYQRKDQSETDL